MLTSSADWTAGYSGTQEQRATPEQLESIARQVAVYVMATNATKQGPPPTTQATTPSIVINSLAPQIAAPLAPPTAPRPAAPPTAPRPAAPPTTTTTTARVFAAGSKDLNVDGEIAPVVSKDGRQAYEITYQKGVIHGEGSNMNATFAPKPIFPATQCRMRFKVFYEPGFPWGADMKRVGGKIIGFEIGRGVASGGSYSTTGASLRLTWSYNGGLGPYLYPQLRESHSRKRTNTNPTWEQLDQHESVRAVSTIASGVHMFYPKDRKSPGAWDLRLKEGAWNDVELFVKLNTPGKYDGVVEVVVNGVTKRNDTVRYRYDESKIMNVKLHTFFGGSNQDYAPTHTTKAWYADFSFTDFF